MYKNMRGADYEFIKIMEEIKENEKIEMKDFVDDSVIISLIKNAYCLGNAFFL